MAKKKRASEDHGSIKLQIFNALGEKLASERRGIRGLPAVVTAERLLNLDQRKDLGFSEYVQAVAKVLEQSEPLGPVEIAFMIQLARGKTKEQILSDEQSRRSGGKSRDRKPALGKGRALVEEVRRIAAKRRPHTAWEWLCSQASSRQVVGSFALDDATENAVTYSFAGDSGSIKKSTFEDYWKRPERTKKSGR